MSADAANELTGLKAAGRRLWGSIVDEYELDEHERALLLQAARTVDVLEALEVEVRRDGHIISSSQGPKAHPALVEARQQKIALARLLAVLRMPTGDEDEQAAGARVQRRVGARGVYGVKGKAS